MPDLHVGAGEAERERESQTAVGCTLIDVPGYTFGVWVTNRSEGARAL